MIKQIKVLALTAVLGAAIINSTAALAGTCLGESCLNLNPLQSDCANDAISVNKAMLLLADAQARYQGKMGPGNGQYAAGFVQEMYSPSCRASWALAALSLETTAPVVGILALDRISQTSRTDIGTVTSIGYQSDGTTAQYEFPGGVASGMFPVRPGSLRAAYGTAALRGIVVQGATGYSDGRQHNPSDSTFGAY